MLEVGVPGQYEKQAEDIIGLRAQGTWDYNFLENLLEGMKDTVTTKVNGYVVEFKNDGTAEATPNRAAANNTMVLEDLLKTGGKTVMLTNDKGFSLCVSPVQVNGKTYLHTFRPEDAQALRESLAEQLPEPPKAPSAYDRFCNWCAETFLNRPGKVVGEYNEKMAFRNAVQKAIDNMTDIPEKVEEFKQSEEGQRLQEEELKKQLEEQKELEKQRELEKRQQEEEALRKAQDEALRKAEQEKIQKAEEEKQRLLDEMKKQKEEQFAKYQPERDKRASEAEKKADEFRLQQVKELKSSIPKRTRELNNLIKERDELKKELKTDAENLETVKGALAKEQQRLKQLEKDIKDSNNTLSDLRKNLTEYEKLKGIQEKKKVQEKELKDAREAIKDLKEQIKQAEIDYKKAGDEYNRIAAGGHLFLMKPEQYLEHLYNEGKAGREQMLQQERAALAAQMKQIEDQIEVRNISKQKIKDEAKVWDVLPVVRGFRQKGQFMSKEDALKADLEKQYKELQKKDQQLVKDFNEGEVEYKKKALDFSPAVLKETEAFLKNGLKETQEKADAFKDAGKRVEKLNLYLGKSETRRSKALREIDYLDSQALGKTYNENLHTRTENTIGQLEGQIKNYLMPAYRDLKMTEIPKHEKMVRDSEFFLDQKEKKVEELNTRCTKLDNALDHDKAAYVNHVRTLHQHGIVIEQAPDMPRVPVMPAQPQQPQPQPQAPTGPAPGR